jgi:hypothetical protein
MTDIIEKTTPIKPEKADIVDGAYEQLLQSANEVSPELTEMLRKKYEEDRQEFAQAAQDFMPTQDPDYWAKSSCSKCHGRGIIGKKHIFRPGVSAQTVRDAEGKKNIANSVTKVDVRCTCTQKSYRKWLSGFRVFFNMLKAQTLAEVVQTTEEERGESEDE